MTQVESDFRVNGLENGPSSMDHTGLEEEPEPIISDQNEGLHENGNADLEMEIDEGLESGQISPSSRRRSTRGAALKAQEKIKLKEGYEGPIGQEDSPQFNGHVESEKDEEKIEDEEEVDAKRPRLDMNTLDQFSHKFGIQIKGDEVVMMQDDSEVSSLNEQQVDVLRKNYEKALARELTDEQKRERLHMVRQAEAALRLEEARLMMLKKVRNIQTNPNKVALEAQKKMTASVPNNASGTAYKPPIATPPSKPSTSTATSNTANAAALQNAKTKAAATTAALLKANPILGLSGLSPSQQQDLLRSLSSAGAHQLLAQAKATNPLNPLLALVQQHQHALQKQQATALAAAVQASSSASASASASTTAAAAPSSSSNNLASQTPQQRAVAARQAFRKQADAQLCSMAPAPKVPPNDLNFIPNGNQPDFCYLLGLDLVVQKVLKDKTVNQPVLEKPYVCEECQTDFTPSWRAIGTSETDLHLYCEQCVKMAQKKKIRTDHTNALMKLFSQFAAQEKNFEEQIANGKLEAVLMEHHSRTAQASSSQAQNLSTKNSASTSHLPSAASRASGSSTPQPPQKTSTPNPSSSTPSGSKSQSHGTPSSSKKNQQTNAAMQLQAQIAAAAANATRGNPMMLMMMQQMMSNPAMVQQMMQNPTMMQNMMQMGWNPMLMMAAQAQQAQQVQAQARLAAAAQQAQHSSQSNSMAMNLLQQAVQNAANSRGGSSNNSNTAMLAQLAMGNLANPAAALLSNPQLLQQIQQQMQKAKK